MIPEPSSAFERRDETTAMRLGEPEYQAIARALQALARTERGPPAAAAAPPTENPPPAIP